MRTKNKILRWRKIYDMLTASEAYEIRIFYGLQPIFFYNFYAKHILEKQINKLFFDCNVLY